MQQMLNPKLVNLLQEKLEALDAYDEIGDMN